MAYDILKGGSTSAILVGPVILSSDHITGATGITLTVTISKNGAAFGSPSGAVTEIGSGWYKIAGNTTDSNTAGPIAVHATGAACDPFDGVMAQIVDPTVTIYGANIGQINGQSASAAAGVAFPSTIASPTNITAGTVSIGAGGIASAAFVGGAVNASALAANAIAATTFAAGAINASAIAANAITATTFAANAINASGVAADAVTKIQTGLATPTNIVSATVSVGAGGIASTAFAANALNASAVAADAVTKIQSGLSTLTITQVLTTAITESYRANGTAPTLAQYMSEVLAHLGETTIAGTTKTIKKFDHSAAAATFSLDSAVSPTTISRAT